MGGIVSAGAQLPGAYLVGDLLRVEAIGEVYEAIPTAKGARQGQALVLHPMFDAVLGPWFRSTAALHEQLSHPSLVEGFAFGQVEGGISAWVTEWLEGKTLRERLVSEGPLPIDEALRVLRSLAAALDHLHNRTPRVLHRALSPDNVRLLEPDHRVKLVGVGDADRFDPPAASPRYLSPEELEAPDQLGPRADVFSLATLAYEALRGEPAFGDSADEVLDAARGMRLPKLGRSSRDPYNDLDAVFRKAWASEPRDRFERPSEFVQALKERIEAQRLARNTPLELTPSGGVGTRSQAMMMEPERVESLRSEMPPPVPAPANQLRSPTLPGARERGETSQVRPVPEVSVPQEPPRAERSRPASSEPLPIRNPNSPLAAVVAEIAANRLGAGSATPYRGVPAVRVNAKGLGVPAATPVRGVPMKPASPIEPKVIDAERIHPDDEEDASERPTQVISDKVVPTSPMQRTNTPAKGLVLRAPQAPTSVPDAAEKGDAPEKSAKKNEPAPWDPRESWTEWAPKMDGKPKPIAKGGDAPAKVEGGMPEKKGFALTQVHLAVLLVALPLLVALVVIVLGRVLK